MFAGVGGRTTGLGYTGDAIRQKYTAYESDSESGLNFARARYQSSSQGRFTSSDPLMASATVANPQSLNRYSYVQNSPLNLVDPNGMMLSDIGVYQTDDAELADTLQRKSDADYEHMINDQYLWAHPGSSGTSTVGDPGNVVGQVTIYGQFEDNWGNPDYAAMSAALWGLARNGHNFGRPHIRSQSGLRNFLAGVIDNGIGPPPIFGYSLGRALRMAADSIAGTSADEDTWSYYGGSWVPDVVGAASGVGAVVDAEAAGVSGRIALDAKPHPFPRLGGRWSHFQLQLWRTGVKGSNFFDKHIPLFTNLSNRWQWQRYFRF